MAIDFKVLKYMPHNNSVNSDRLFRDAALQRWPVTLSVQPTAGGGSCAVGVES